MNWNKLRKQLDTFVCDELQKQVSFSQSGYRYTSDKKSQAYILIEKKEVFNMKKNAFDIKWFTSEAEAKKSLEDIYVAQSYLDTVKENHPNVPDDRIIVIARNNLASLYAKTIYQAQVNLLKSDFQQLANDYLSTSLNKCLESDDIILNVLALLDRRIGKNKLNKLEYKMKLKHPIVQYFYRLRKEA